MFSSQAPNLNELLIEAQKICEIIQSDQDQQEKLGKLTPFLANLSQKERYDYFHKLIEINPNLIRMAKHKIIDANFFMAGDYLKLCLFGAKQSKKAKFDFNIETVQANFLNQTEYDRVCRAILLESGAQFASALGQIDVNKLSENLFYKLCNDVMKAKLSMIMTYIKCNSTVGDEFYFKIEMLGVSKYNSGFKSVQFDRLGKDEIERRNNYFALCKAGLAREGLELKNVNFDNLPQTPANCYDLLCEIAVKKTKEAERYINFERLNDKSTYEKIFLAEIKKDGLMLGKVRNEKLVTKDIQKEFMREAVKQNGLAMQFIDNTEANNLFYEELCQIAVQQNGFALQYIDSKSLDVNFYMQLCEMAVQQNPLAIKKINIDMITDKPFLSDLTLTAVSTKTQDFKQDPEALRFALNNSDEANKLLIVQGLTVEAILQADVTLYHLLPNNNQEINEAAIEFIGSIEHVVVVKDDDRLNGEIQDSYLVYANKEFKDKPEKNRKGKTVVCNKSTVNDAFTIINEIKSLQPTQSNPINLVLLSHFSARHSEIAGLLVDDIEDIVEKNPLINRVTLLGCNTVVVPEKLEKEKEIMQRYEAEKSKEDHIRDCPLLLLLRMPTEDELKRVFKKNQAAYILIRTGKEDHYQYQMLYVELDKQHSNNQALSYKQVTYPLDDQPRQPNKKTQLEFLQVFNGSQHKPFKFPANEKKDPLYVQEEFENEDGEKGSKHLLLNYEQRRYIKDICSSGVVGYSPQHNDYQQRKQETPSLSKVRISMDDPDFAKITPNQFMYKLAQKLSANSAIKREIIIKAFTGILSVHVQENTFIVTPNYMFNSKEYGPSMYANKENAKAINEKALREHRMTMNENKQVDTTDTLAEEPQEETEESAKAKSSHVKSLEVVVKPTHKP